MLKCKLMNVNSSKKPCPSFSHVKEVVESKREIVEQSRRGSVRRIQQDIQRIIKRERESSKNILEELFPLKITWNEDAINKLKEFIPIQIEYLREEDDVIDPEIMSDDPNRPIS